MHNAVYALGAPCCWSAPVRQRRQVLAWRRLDLSLVVNMLAMAGSSTPTPA